MVTVNLVADVELSPSTGRWRVSALDSDRLHIYLSGGPVLTHVLDNVVALIQSQYAPEGCDIIGTIKKVGWS